MANTDGPNTGVHLGHVRGVLISLVGIYLLFSVKRLNSFYWLSVLHLFFMIFSCLFSRDITTSLIIFSKYFSATMMFFIGIYSVRTIKDFKILIISVFVSSFVILSYIVSSNVIGFGEAGYSGEGILFGYVGVNIVKSLSVAIFLVPISLDLFRSKFSKSTLIFLLIICVALIGIALKRGTILSVVLGYFTLIYFSPFRLKYVRAIPFVLLLLFAVSPFFIDEIATSFKSRAETLESQSLFSGFDQSSGQKTEGRVVEFYWVLENFWKSDFFSKIFGTDPFLTRNNALGINFLERMNHIDFTSLLDSFGLIGLLTYLIWYTSIAVQLYRNTKLSSNRQYRNLLTIGLILIVIQISQSISGTITAIDPRGLILLNLGGIFGIIQELKIRSKAFPRR